jgi:hypothetical protein
MSFPELRNRLVRALHRLSGRELGQVMAWWVRLIWCLLRPVTVIELLAAKVYDPSSGVYTLNGCKFTEDFFLAAWSGAYPSHWFRTVKRPDGSLALEVRQGAWPSASRP